MKCRLWANQQCSLETRTLTLSVSQAHAHPRARAFFSGRRLGKMLAKQAFAKANRTLPYINKVYYIKAKKHPHADAYGVPEKCLSFLGKRNKQANGKTFGERQKAKWSAVCDANQQCSLETRTLTLSVSQAHACLFARAFFLGPTAPGKCHTSCGARVSVLEHCI